MSPDLLLSWVISRQSTCEIIGIACRLLMVVVVNCATAGGGGSGRVIGGIEIIGIRILVVAGDAGNG